MVIREQSRVSIAKLETTDLGTYTKEQVREHVDTVVDAIAADFRKKFTAARSYESGPLKITLDHPFTASTIVAHVKAAAQSPINIPISDRSGVKKYDCNVLKLTSGAVILTMMGYYLQAALNVKWPTLIQDSAVRSRVLEHSNYQNSLTRLAKFQNLAVYMLPLAEEAIGVHLGNLYVQQPVEPLFVPGLETVPWSVVPYAIKGKVEDFRDTALDEAVVATDVPVEYLNNVAALMASVDVSSWLSADIPWIRIPSTFESIAYKESEVLKFVNDPGPWTGLLFTAIKWMRRGQISKIKDVSRTFESLISAIDKVKPDAEVAIDTAYDTLLDWVSDTDSTNPQAAYEGLRIMAGMCPMQVSWTTTGSANEDVAERNLARSFINAHPTQWPAGFSFTGRTLTTPRGQTGSIVALAGHSTQGLDDWYDADAAFVAHTAQLFGYYLSISEIIVSAILGKLDDRGTHYVTTISNRVGDFVSGYLQPATAEICEPI